MNSDRVWVLQHNRPDGRRGSRPDMKLLGVYSCELRAQEAMARAVKKPGFREHLENFEIRERILNRCDYDEGFEITDSSDIALVRPDGS